MSDNDLLFSEPEDVGEEQKEESDKKYRLLIVDDEPGIHEVTKMALRQFKFHGASLEILGAYSGKEAKEILSSETDIAVILLDVVMETFDAGLQVADWIRNDLKNNNVRIVLRTGQPGNAPESDIMVRYDINDYKEKTELTNRKLNTLMYSCLRGYNDIQTIDRVSNKLKQIIAYSNELFKTQTGERFAKSVIDLLSKIIVEDNSIPPTKISSFTCKNRKIVYATGEYESRTGEEFSSVCNSEFFEQLLSNGVDDVVISDREIYAYLKSDINEFMVYVENINKTADIDHDILKLFFKHVSIGYKNLENEFAQH